MHSAKLMTTCILGRTVEAAEADRLQYVHLGVVPLQAHVRDSIDSAASFNSDEAAIETQIWIEIPHNLYQNPVYIADMSVKVVRGRL